MSLNTFIKLSQMIFYICNTVNLLMNESGEEYGIHRLDDTFGGAHEAIP